MKAMTIGISPNYNYPGSYEKWRGDNTYYASNHGGSLITRAIMKEFDADYIDDFSDISFLQNKYDTCICALATHANKSRDISKYVEILEKLQMRVIVISLGVSDYVVDSTFYNLHYSVKRLLHLASDSSKWIGVRGPYTASIIMKNGFKNVVPIGCPTLYWNMSSEFNLGIKEKYHNPLVVYHKTMMKANYELIKEFVFLGQDFQDQAIFTKSLDGDIKLQEIENKYYSSLENESKVREIINNKGIFYNEFDSWFNEIGKHDFVFGPRLHGCIAALIQGIPAILLPRDLRVREIVEVFNLPHIDYQNLKGKTILDVQNKVDFRLFRETYKKRFNNYCAFIRENALEANKNVSSTIYEYLPQDIQTTNYILFSELEKLNTKQYGNKNFKEYLKSNKIVKKCIKYIKK